MAHKLLCKSLQVIISKGLNMKRQFVLFALLLMVLLPLGARAQEVASLTGIVTDPSGAVLPGVTVKLQDSKTGTRYETKTNSDGGYTFARLLPGPGYRLELTKEGFETTTISSIYVAVGTTHTQNAEMQIGKISESVEVSGAEQAVTLAPPMRPLATTSICATCTSADSDPRLAGCASGLAARSHQRRSDRRRSQFKS
jgi:hypothetical protein